MISITRHTDIGRLEKTGNYLFVYGRRKTGKTYLIKNYLDWDKYYFVGRDNVIYEENQTLSYETFQRELFQLLKEGKLGLNIETILEKDFDIDIVLTDFKKPKIAGEVKWAR